MESEILRTTQQADPLIQVKIRLKESYILASADITLLNFFSPSLAHVSFLVHNFEFMIHSLSITFPKESETPPITNLADFYTFLNSIELYNSGAEFKYITDTKPKYKQWQTK
jgi:hypothetical protein